MPKYRTKRLPTPKREPEKVIGQISVVDKLCLHDYANSRELVADINTVLDVGHCIETANGRYYRIAHSIFWAEAKQVAEITDFTSHVVKSVNNSFNVVPISGINIDKSSSTNAARKLHPKSKANTSLPVQMPKKASTNHMNKTEFRSIVSALTAGQNITVKFSGSKVHQSGEYNIKALRTGRGKGGSRLIDLVRLTDNLAITTGTPDSGSIVNITVNGEVHGFESENDMPVTFERNAAMAVAVKRVAKRLMDLHAQNATATHEVTLGSTFEGYSGTFQVISANRMRGRGGPAKLVLKNSVTGEQQELWSSRQSGALTSIEIVGDNA